MRLALTIRGARLLYLNETRQEAERLAWYGIQNDGMASLIERYGIKAKLDHTDLSIYFPETDSWIWLRGAKDEKEIRKALGGAYHEVWWDEAQKIPSKLENTIREVFMPTLLDFGGRFRLTGSPVRQMGGLFYRVTQEDASKRPEGWSVHHWNLLANPHFGKTLDERHLRGMLALQKLYGGEKVAPFDSPIMMREGSGIWVREDAAYVYYVHKVKQADLFYAPARNRDDGFPDVVAALADLPWDWREAFFAMGVDIGYSPDPFAFVLWAWHPHDPVLYEVCSWKRTHLTSDNQAKAIAEIRMHVAIGLIVADAGGPAKPTVAGWSVQFVERFGLPILEAEKHKKHSAIEMLNGDIVNGLVKLREGGELYEEMSLLQWSHLVSGTGKLIEDPTMANHCCDGGLYGARHAYQYRSRPEDKLPPKGSMARLQREAAEIEADMLG